MYYIKGLFLIILLHLPAPIFSALVRTLMPQPLLTLRQQNALFKHYKRCGNPTEYPPTYNPFDDHLPTYSQFDPEQPPAYTAAGHESPPAYSMIDPLRRKSRQEEAFARHIERTRKK